MSLFIIIMKSETGGSLGSKICPFTRLDIFNPLKKLLTTFKYFLKL